MIEFDKLAGTHFDGKTVAVTNHAIDQAEADFGIARAEATAWLNTQAHAAQYIGIMYGENRRRVRLYGINRIAIVMAEFEDVIITVYHRNKVDERLRNPIEDLIADIITNSQSNLEAIEAASERALGYLRELLESAIRMRETSSGEDVKSMSEKWVSQVMERIEKEERVLDTARQDHARMLKGVVAYV